FDIIFLNLPCDMDPPLANLAERRFPRPAPTQLTGVAGLAGGGTLKATFRARFWFAPTRGSPAMRKGMRSELLGTRIVGTLPPSLISVTSSAPAAINSSRVR